MTKWLICVPRYFCGCVLISVVRLLFCGPLLFSVTLMFMTSGGAKLVVEASDYLNVDFSKNVGSFFKMKTMTWWLIYRTHPNPSKSNGVFCSILLNWGRTSYYFKDDIICTDKTGYWSPAYKKSNIKKSHHKFYSFNSGCESQKI